MKKQKKIAGWLKLLCFMLAIMFAIFFGGLTWYKLSTGKWFIEDSHHIQVYFSWYVAVLAYAVLFQFWKVCCEIEKDNSFSLENARSFHLMALFGVAAGVGYILRIIYVLFMGMINFILVIYAVAMICLCIVFIIVCECLSQLIKNAYEIKQENEFTI